MFGCSSSSRTPEAFASAHSSVTDLPTPADATDAAPTTVTADSEEEDFSCNGDDTDSLSHEVGHQLALAAACDCAVTMAVWRQHMRPGGKCKMLGFDTHKPVFPVQKESQSVLPL